MRISVLILLLFLSTLLVISQDGSRLPAKLDLKLKEAWSAYTASQQLAMRENYDELKEEQLNTKALRLFREVIAEMPFQSDSLQHKIHFAIGELEHYFTHYNEAMTEYRWLIGKYQQHLLPDSLFFLPHLYAGLIYYQRGDIDSATISFLTADSIQQKYTAPLAESQRLYNTLGVLSYDAGNYRQSLNYFRKALEMVDHNDPSFLDLESNYLINIAQAELKLGEYDNALATYQQLIPLQKNLNEIYHNMGIALTSKGKLQEALNYLGKVEFSDEKKPKLFNSFARVYLKMGQPGQCREYLSKALAAYPGITQNQHTLGETFQLLGDLAMQQDSAQIAIEEYSKAISYFYPDFQPQSAREVPTRFTGIFSYIELYETLVAKAKAWHRLYTVKQDRSAGQLELQTYLAAYSLLDHVMATYESDEARLFINTSRYGTHDQPIRIAYELYKSSRDSAYLHKLYMLDQQNKAAVLALQVVRAETMTGDPALQKASSVKKKIVRLNRLAAVTSNATQLQQYRTQIRDLELELSRLRDRTKGLEKSALLVPGIRELQQNLLESGTAIISYHLSDSEVTSTLITPSTLTAERKALPPQFREKLQEYVDALKDPAKKIPSDLSQQMYQLLLGEVSHIHPSRLIVIPDNELLYLPFETLRDPEGQWAMQQFSILYQYSTALLKKASPIIRSDHDISFAPFAVSAMDSFAALPFSKDEIARNKGKQFVDMKATKAAFLNNAEQAGLIHLATHASANEQPGSSFLVFRDSSGKADLLYDNEIYIMNLRNTRMVILSACETASGKLLQGEGVMSLSRAFTYAGVNDIITTQWKADDKTTAYLVTRLQQHLTNGITSDEALQKAKLDLLADPQLHPRFKHPYYWSQLIIIGNYQPGPKKHWPWLTLLVLLAAGSGGYLYRRRFLTRQ